MVLQLKRAEEIRGLPRGLAETIPGFSLSQPQLKKFARPQAGLTATRFPWKLVNFDLPSGLLAKIWDVQVFEINSTRCRCQRG